MLDSRAGQHTLRQHEKPGPLREVSGGVHHRRNADTKNVGPMVSRSLGYMLESRDVRMKDGREGGREVELEGGFKGRGDAGGTGMPEAAEGEETGDGGLEKGAEEEEAGNTGASGGGTRGRELRQFLESPGRQREQGVPPLAQKHLRHFAVPLQRQQRVETEAGRVEIEAERVETEAGDRGRTGGDRDRTGD